MTLFPWHWPLSFWNKREKKAKGEKRVSPSCEWKVFFFFLMTKEEEKKSAREGKWWKPISGEKVVITTTCYASFPSNFVIQPSSVIEEELTRNAREFSMSSNDNKMWNVCDCAIFAAFFFLQSTSLLPFKKYTCRFHDATCRFYIYIFLFKFSIHYWW